MTATETMPGERTRAGAAASASPIRMFVDGRWHEPDIEDRWQHVDPATGLADFSVPVASAADVNRAVGAARRAFDEGPWSHLHPRERKLALRPLADLLRTHADELHRLQTRDNGIPIDFGSSYRMSALMAADIFEYHIGWIDKLGGDAPPPFSPETPTQALVLKEPIGVVGAITPFNAPVLQFAQKVAPALAAGCTIVIKPSEFASGVAHRYAELIAELDLPPGVFNLVTGLGATGAALASHGDLDKITFTGRREIGERVVAGAGTRSVALELGGKSPSIVFDDVRDLDAVARTAMSLVSMGLSGQVCSTQTRSLVQRSVYEAFVESARAQIADVRYGDPFDPTTTSAPIITPTAAARALRLVEDAVADGGRLVTGGRTATLAGPEAGGNWVEPTLIADVDADMPIAREEVFGPVLAVIPFDDEDDAVRLANASEYGLSAGVYTGDLARALRVGRRLRSGTVGVNGPFVFTPGTPFGGYKTSGLGREGGREGIEEFLETKTITVSLH
ncbi:aldehyde dehydrogenase family protein [Nonomuraea sp. NPDC049141]|uniref:aldehyde dehydrogenase family protein n=1 Tax=Nonomuraea sp. NPDC049141 TaxID=3155500 RepID=UPI0033FBC9CD